MLAGLDRSAEGPMRH